MINMIFIFLKNFDILNFFFFFLNNQGWGKWLCWGGSGASPHIAAGTPYPPKYTLCPLICCSPPWVGGRTQTNVMQVLCRPVLVCSARVAESLGLRGPGGRAGG